MENNILTNGKQTVIICGGNGLKDCPDNYDEANKWADNANDNPKIKDGPEWSFDCGFKLDYDGSILRVSSRFYPPKTHYGPTWDGNVTIYFLDKEISKQKFDCKTLNDLKLEVEIYVSDVISKIEILLNDVTNI